MLDGAEAAQSVLGAGALLHCNTGAWVSLPLPRPWGLGLGAWGLGGQQGGEGHLPVTLRTHWRKQLLWQHFIFEGHWLSSTHWSGTDRRQGPSSGGHPPCLSGRDPPRYCGWRQTRVLESGLTRDSPALNSPPFSSCLSFGKLLFVVVVLWTCFYLFIFI